MASQAVKETARECRIRFLGLWDTVKSYGGLRRVMCAHLRHNPIVDTVRHALALDEQRGWFDATTWGRLDLAQEKNRGCRSCRRRNAIASWRRTSARSGFGGPIS